MSVPNPSPPREQVKKCHEEGATDDRPHDRKRIAAHAEDEGFDEMELALWPVDHAAGSLSPPPSGTSFGQAA
jgi:hypothetical protein